MKRTVSVVAVSAMLCGWGLAAGVATGDAAPEFSVTDASGKTHNLSDYKGKYVVLEWVNYKCPFVARHYSSKNMQELQKKYTDKGVVWLSVCSSAPGNQGHLDAAGALEAAKKNGHAGTAYLLDESGEMGRAYGARTTPHMFVLTPEGKVGYQGAIDSDRRKSDGATNYVAEFLDLSMNGEAAPNTSTTPYGCGVKYAR